MMDKEQQIANTPRRKYLLFVSKIPANTNKKTLAQYFCKFGKVKIRSLSSIPKAKIPMIAKIEALNSKTYEGILSKPEHQFLTGVSIQVEKLLKGDHLKKKNEQVYKRRISIFGVYGHLKKKKLKSLFSKFGEVETCFLKRYHDNKKKSHGFVTFIHAESALQAINKKFIWLNHAKKKKKIKIKPFQKWGKTYFPEVEREVHILRQICGTRQFELENRFGSGWVCPNTRFINWNAKKNSEVEARAGEFCDWMKNETIQANIPNILNEASTNSPGLGFYQGFSFSGMRRGCEGNIDEEREEVGRMKVHRNIEEVCIESTSDGIISCAEMVQANHCGENLRIF